MIPNPADRTSFEPRPVRPRVSVRKFFGHNFRLPEPFRLVFLTDRNAYFSRYIKKLELARTVRPSNFYMVEYCEIFKMTFLKILDFLRVLKIRSKAPDRYEL